MTKDEALDLALEALEANQPVNYCVNSKGEKFPMLTKDPFKFERNAKAITAIKQARALDKKADNARELGLDYEPVQEPVADAMARYLRVCSSGGMPKKLKESVQNLVYDAARLGYFKAATPPAAQRQWVYLTELEKSELWNRDTTIPFSYADAIEAKLKEKNT